MIYEQFTIDCYNPDDCSTIVHITTRHGNMRPCNSTSNNNTNVLRFTLNVFITTNIWYCSICRFVLVKLPHHTRLQQSRHSICQHQLTSSLLPRRILCITRLSTRLSSYSLSSLCRNHGREFTNTCLWCENEIITRRRRVGRTICWRRRKYLTCIVSVFPFRRIQHIQSFSL